MFRFLFLLIVIISIGLYALDRKGTSLWSNAPPVASTKTVSSAVSATTTVRRVLLGIPVPGGSEDRLFEVALPDGTLRERDESKGWRLAAMQSGKLHLIPGATADQPWLLTDDGTFRVPIRTKRGDAYDEVRLLGAFDASHAAVLGKRDDPILLAVSRFGEIREIYRLPETAFSLGVSGDRAWFATFVPGEGMESAPTGPSELIRVELDGTSSTRVTEKSVIASVIALNAETYAYATESGDVKAVAGLQSWAGQGKPLLWLNDHELLYAKGTAVSLVDLERGEQTAVATLPLSPTKAVQEP